EPPRLVIIASAILYLTTFSWMGSDTVGFSVAYRVIALFAVVIRYTYPQASIRALSVSKFPLITTSTIGVSVASRPLTVCVLVYGAGPCQMVSRVVVSTA